MDGACRGEGGVIWDKERVPLSQTFVFIVLNRHKTCLKQGPTVNMHIVTVV